VAFVVELLREAAEEMTAASAFYEERREGLGDRFLDVVRATILRVGQAPLASALFRVPGLAAIVRRRPVPGFPFFIIYTTEPAIVVVAVAHMRRKPSYWRARLVR
jgi:toxin ParE1/3/4